eukprot:NODE_592_length_6322_cov_0.357063.p3 type:complete len:233 gc:universal NODE_592_length_6322_cov_0.357063:4783-4085(-)
MEKPIILPIIEILTHDILLNSSRSLIPKMDDQKTFICKWTNCAAESDTNKSLYEHYIDQHLIPQQNLENLSCEWKSCHYQAANLSSLRSHGLRHIPYRQYACQQCGRTFKWKHDRNKHFARLHTKQQPSPMLSMYQNLSPMYMNQMMAQPQMPLAGYQQHLQPHVKNHQDYRSVSPSPSMATSSYSSPVINSFTAPELQMFDFMSRGIESSKSPNLMDLPAPEEDLINFTSF